MKFRNPIVTFLLVLLSGIAFGQITQKVFLTWESPTSLVMGNDSPVQAPFFTGAQYPNLPESLLPSYAKRFALPQGTTSVTISIENVVFTELTSADRLLLGTSEIPHQALPGAQVMAENKKSWAVVSLVPFAVNPATSVLSKIQSFTLHLDYPESSASPKSTREYASNSVLSSGDWFKIFIKESGIYKITYDDLRNLGVNMTGLNPDMIRIFGNGGALLNEAAGADRIDDLAENAIKVVAATPGSFASGDYVLFYGKGTLKWALNPFTGRIEHTTHFYADDACYFVTIGPVAGKRIQQDAEPAGEPNYYSVAYTDYVVHENDALSLIKSGRKWYGEKFDYYTRSFNLPVYQFPDMILSEPVSIRYGFAAQASAQSTCSILINGEIAATKTIGKVPGNNDFALEFTTSAAYIAGSNNLAVQVKFIPPNNTALGWLDFVALNVRCNLRFKGGQMAFRDPRAAGDDHITSFTMSNAVDGMQLWDVSDHASVKSVQLNKVGDQYTFKLATAGLIEFVAFDGSSFMSVTPGGKVINQNLHATGNYDMIIVTHPDFASEAQRLAMLHNNKADITAAVVLLPEIYNEFSSGIQDVTAIRDFMKMLYDRGNGQAKPQYLLLFGTASYDVKNRIAGNTNFVPTYQSENSIHLVLSFLTDDYFGLLDDGEGAHVETEGLVDVASGRFPVRTPGQAKTVVDKIEYYLNNSASTHGDWRNTLIVIADDQNKNVHLDQAEKLTDSIALHNPEYNVEKIYFDAYKQQSTPGGSRYPDVNREIVTRVEKGALLTNYIGHGGDVGWADERVLEIADIEAWTNINRMGIFFTATCEFSRFDNPAHTSAGELVFLNPNGGAMSMITTTRLAYSNLNANLNLSFIDTLLKSENGSCPRLGDILRFTKNDNSFSINNRHITLFGDPSMLLPYPKHQIYTTSISYEPDDIVADSLFANSLITVQGEVRDVNDQMLSDFNGVLYVKVFDKPSKVRTLGQDSDSEAVDFMVQKNILYQGKASVNNGVFSFTFPVPLDIDYSFGKGKISYYATNGTEDAHGYYNNLVIGGSVSPVELDVTGPQIELFINDSTFVNGDFTSENPKLLAKLYDESGINTVGNGIGHDIMAIIDGDSYSSALLNDYYVADLDSYQGGLVRYQYFNLPDGEHTLTLKAWDVFNNSASASITFNVKRNIVLAVDELKAAPNPSAGDVWFSFGHNQFDGVFNVDIEIYSLSGSLVRTIGPLTITSAGYAAGNIKWDGRTTSGYVARNGLYVCRMRVRDRNNYTTSNTVKVILAR